MIELRNVTKSYPAKGGPRYILKDVSLVIPDRVNVAVLGPNGAGKSTLLRLIGGTESADSGVIETDRAISWPLGLASGFQKSLTGRQNVMFICRINGLSDRDTRRVIKEVISFSELGAYFEMPVNTYSSGMRSRLTFAMSMVFDFDVYLVDELTSVGDQVFRAKAVAAFENIRRRGSIIYVSHNLKTLRLSCESALFLRDGQATYYEELAEGIRAYRHYMKESRKHKTRKLPEIDFPE